MGIIHSSTRFLVSKLKDEELGDESPIPQDLQDDYISCGDESGERLPKLFILSISIYKLLKGLLRKAAGSFSCLAKGLLRKSADPLLPVSSIRSEPILEAPPVSSPTTTFDDEESVDVDCVTWRSLSSENLTEEDEEEEVNTRTSIVTVVEDERWIKHYSSHHRILLVGEGDFSFSACLAVAFQRASNIIATSLDSQAFLRNNYGDALSNIKELRSRGSTVMHGINATTMANHGLLGQLRFDRIIYNFPYAGLDVKNEARQVQLGKHQTLVRLFLENAREMISEKGEIHITHKTNGFHSEWRLVSLARGCGLRLIEAIRFNHLDYPGYNTKCGFGGDKNFYCYPSQTYKFGI